MLHSSANRTSLLAIIVANFYPFFGVIIFDWDIGPIVYLYWLETAIIWFYSILKMIIAKGKVEGFEIDKKPSHSKKHLITVFSIVVLLFMALQFFFIEIFVEDSHLSSNYLEKEGLVNSLFLLALSHGISFIINFLLKGEYKKANPALYSQVSFDRIIVIQLFIVGGAFFVMVFNDSDFSLLVFIMAKIFFDIHAQLKEKQKLAGS